ncbi:RidA family protein [Novosphingobium humi]|uniref:RidA family protein n=1 Tax=Novosphingobium humi TaxID=2282397 RepID=A0ABY7TZ40_9SPHN|nr:RidA family protein [Novosphingobium humi]WCT78306.1 RidA family protein [Novosphingobium humi]
MEKALSPILTDQAPAPAGHYAQAIRAGDTLYVSGQLPIRADKAPLEDMGFAAQARQAIANMLAILEAADGTPEDLCRVTAYIVGVENWPEFNRVYADMLGEARPARTVVPVPELHYGYLVEIDAVAMLRD